MSTKCNSLLVWSDASLGCSLSGLDLANLTFKFLSWVPLCSYVNKPDFTLFYQFLLLVSSIEVYWLDYLLNASFY